MKDFSTANRAKFQNKALMLISTADGVETLANSIVNEIAETNYECVVIDGVRNLDTYNFIKMNYPQANLLYIDLPRDSAYKMYHTRSDGRKVDIHEFRDARHHDVEKEITLFKTRADAYLFNGGNLRDLYKAINQWWHERNKL